MCPVAGGGYLYCDREEGHSGQHSKTFVQHHYTWDSTYNERREALIARYRKALQHIDEITTGSLPVTYMIKEIIREALADTMSS